MPYIFADIFRLNVSQFITELTLKGAILLLFAESCLTELSWLACEMKYFALSELFFHWISHTSSTEKEREA